MINADTIQLDIWKGDWGLPSVDIDCLQVLAYAKITGVPLKVNRTNNPFRTPNGRLPVLRCGKTILNNVSDIIQYFHTRNYIADSNLSNKQSMDITAYSCMFREKLYPALQFEWWVNHKNFNECIRPWYYKAMPFPFNFYYPSKFEREAKNMLETLYPMEENINAIEKEVYSGAQKCITLLSTRLQDSEYFYGAEPTTIDAVIYSYLAPLFKTPLPNAALQNHLKACTNLTAYLSRITQRYFNDEYEEYERFKSKEKAKKMRRDSEEEFPNKRRNQVLAGLFAALAMMGYALSTGIVEVQVTDDDDNGLEDTEEYLVDE